MPRLLDWLLDVKSFPSPQVGIGLTDVMVTINICSLASVGIAFLASAALLHGLAHHAKPGSAVAQMRWPSRWVAGMLAWTGVAYWMRVLVFFWPAYRLMILLNIIVALYGWVFIAFVAPIAERRFTKDGRDG